MSISVHSASAELDDAQTQSRAIPQLPEGLDLDSAYGIQHEVIARRCARGERTVGAKLGFTSRAKAVQMGVSDVIVGRLTDAMQVVDGANVDLARFIHPRIEPEVAFRLARDVDSSESPTELANAVDAVAPALEIIDSRYRDFRFSLPDVIADNTSAAAFVIGAWQPFTLSPRTRDIGNLAVELRVDGAVAEVGSTAAILGHPLRALPALCEMARRYDIELRAGQVILAGAATAAVPFAASVVVAHIAQLGTVTVRGSHG